jgi:hypothetical protein
MERHYWFLHGHQYLNAALNESLRLAEPDPNFNQHSTPKEGAAINGRYIPSFTQLSISQMDDARDERNFIRANRIHPGAMA